MGFAIAPKSTIYILECDACGRAEQRNIPPDQEPYWSNVSTLLQRKFCCPGCLEKVHEIIEKKAKADAAAEAEKAAAEREKIANCEHDYRPRGLLSQCTKCGNFRG